MYTSTPIFYNTHLQLALFGQHGPMTKKRRKVSHLMSWKWHAMPLFLPLWCGSAHPICMFFPTPYLLSYIHLLTLGISSLSPYKSKVKSPMLQRKEDYSSSRSFHFFHVCLSWTPTLEAVQHALMHFHFTSVSLLSNASVSLETSLYTFSIFRAPSLQTNSLTQRTESL